MVTNPKSADEWTRWIRANLASYAKSYIAKPERLIADFRRERQITVDYRGRELLELLQNANDAAAEADSLGG